MARKVKAVHQSFEGRNQRGQFVKITSDMMTSAAWQALTLRQRGLYLQLKAKYRERKVNGVVVESNKDDISLPASEWGELYGGNYRAYKADMDALKEHGFIRTIQIGRYTRTPNIYGFSDAWATGNGRPTGDGERTPRHQ